MHSISSLVRGLSIRGDFQRGICGGRSPSVRRLTRQLGSPLSPTSFQNHAAGPRRHARSKPVHTFSFNATWLICAFHDYGKITENKEMQQEKEARRLLATSSLVNTLLKSKKIFSRSIGNKVFFHCDDSDLWITHENKYRLSS